ncbi:hypothetical protein EWM64_g2276 [Hericium alpestre]|uniref:Uncharacterized protein n=1 Tax=Hericium alpestre TaxID=135208 RepID=A0A4Z0A4U8_9AGAM|nr:hypothetical protein EWM64_g2276 [Hericium alpestre]
MQKNASELLISGGLGFSVFPEPQSALSKSTPPGVRQPSEGLDGLSEYVRVTPQERVKEWGPRADLEDRTSQRP